MQRRWIASLAGVAACALVPSLQAQGGARIAVMPFAGFSIPGAMTSNDTLQLKPKAAAFGGLAFELTMSKTVGLSFGVSRTVGQKLSMDQPVYGAGNTAEADMSMTQLAATIVYRPGGRRPNGAPTPLYLEVGAGLNMYRFGNMIISGSAYPASDFNASQPMGIVGAGMNYPIGPRASVQVFGRAIAVGKYTSKGLDDFNASPPPTGVTGKMALGFQFGVGLRVGR